jgi:hypothetical protein
MDTACYCMVTALLKCCGRTEWGPAAMLGGNLYFFVKQTEEGTDMFEMADESQLSAPSSKYNVKRLPLNGAYKSDQLIYAISANRFFIARHFAFAFADDLGKLSI